MKLLLVSGARPNFMKIAPLIHCIQRHNAGRRNGSPHVDFTLVHTGQHYDAQMSDIFFRELAIPAPDVTLDVGSGSHAVQTANVMTRFEPVCEREKPDWVVVVGDVNSTVACTLVAAKLGTKVAHVEAGLRSFDRTMPEEINRIVTDSLADLLLTPSQDADENLRREGVPEHKIKCVGNIMIDALVSNLSKSRESTVLGKVGVKPGDFAYVTLHRPSNVDHQPSLVAIMSELNRLAGRLPVVFPMHPRTRKMCAQFGIPLDASQGMKIVDPIGYHDSLCLTENARLVVTDSGGLQEESTFFRTSCLTLRPNTERPVTITLGSNRLTTVQQLPEDIKIALHGAARSGQVPPLWDGRAAERVLENLLATSSHAGLND
jgi:UDP-N-acetylglucosamine 2-epimerase (non-hydrolysing)